MTGTVKHRTIKGNQTHFRKTTECIRINQNLKLQKEVDLPQEQSTRRKSQNRILYIMYR